MNNQEILEKAIQKAIDGGFNPTYEIYVSKQANLELPENKVFELIFNHDFAKALWGERDEDRITIIGETDWRKWPLPWQYHLQQMVTAEDPIKYLGENI